MADALREAEPGLEVEIVPIRTSGDERRGEGRPEGVPGDKSRFVKEIEEALLDGDVDLAVHSAKDVPGELPDGLSIVGVPARADARDSLCGGARSLGELPEAASVGTSSLRRRAQLLALRPDLRVQDLRGNVDTRLRKLADGEHDAVVLAAAGLARLGRREGVPIPPDEMIPAPGQGCLALEARADDEPAAGLAAAVSDRDALLRLTAERACVMVLEASCRTPVAAYAELRDGRLALAAFAGAPDGSSWVRDRLEGPAEDAAVLGAGVAERLLAAGAGDLLAAADRG